MEIKLYLYLFVFSLFALVAMKHGNRNGRSIIVDKYLRMIYPVILFLPLPAWLIML